VTGPELGRPLDAHLIAARAAADAVWAAEQAQSAAYWLRELMAETPRDRDAVMRLATVATRAAKRSTRRAALARAALVTLRAAYPSPDPVVLRTTATAAQAAEVAAHQAARASHAARRATLAIHPVPNPREAAR
jgi:hypothetical protein